MCSLGLTLTRADFRRVLVAPRGVAIGMLNLALISPLLAFAMAELFALPPSWRSAWSCSAPRPAE